MAATRRVPHQLVFALQVFYPHYDQPTAFQLRLSVTGLGRFAPGVGEGHAGHRIAERAETWANRLPRDARELWTVLAVMPGLEVAPVYAAICGERLMSR